MLAGSADSRSLNWLRPQPSSSRDLSPLFGCFFWWPVHVYFSMVTFLAPIDRKPNLQWPSLEPLRDLGCCWEMLHPTEPQRIAYAGMSPCMRTASFTLLLPQCTLGLATVVHTLPRGTTSACCFRGPPRGGMWVIWSPSSWVTGLESCVGGHKVEFWSSKFFIACKCKYDAEYIYLLLEFVT